MYRPGFRLSGWLPGRRPFKIDAGSLYVILRGCKFFCVYGGKILPIRFRYFFLTTERIGFSEWQEDDIELAKLLWGEPSVTRFICASGKFSEDDIVSRLKKEIDINFKFHVQYWPIFKMASNELIGCCGL